MSPPQARPASTREKSLWPKAEPARTSAHLPLLCRKQWASGCPMGGRIVVRRLGRSNPVAPRLRATRRPCALRAGDQDN
eukprot:10742167-Alexandrium_andersonii.AAC.1